MQPEGSAWFVLQGQRPQGQAPWGPSWPVQLSLRGQPWQALQPSWQLPPSWRERLSLPVLLPSWRVQPSSQLRPSWQERLSLLVLLPSWQVQPSLRLRVWPLQPSLREQPFLRPVFSQLPSCSPWVNLQRALPVCSGQKAIHGDGSKLHLHEHGNAPQGSSLRRCRCWAWCKNPCGVACKKRR